MILFCVLVPLLLLVEEKDGSKPSKALLIFDFSGTESDFDSGILIFSLSSVERANCSAISDSFVN